MSERVELDEFVSPFPASKRATFDRNPLDFVVMQLVFENEVELTDDLIDQFIAATANRFSKKSIRPVFSVHVTIGADQIEERGAAQPNIYDLLTPDDSYVVSLGSGFIALHTKKYTSWEDFRENTLVSLEALVKVFSTQSFTRVGLRYRDRVNRNQLGLAGASWPDLFREFISGDLQDQEFTRFLLKKATNVEVKLDEHGGIAVINHGIIQENDNEEYIVDADFINLAGCDHGSVISQLNALKRHAGRFWRWCIKPHLFAALGGREIE